MRYTAPQVSLGKIGAPATVLHASGQCQTAVSLLVIALKFLGLSQHQPHQQCDEQCHEQQCRCGCFSASYRACRLSCFSWCCLVRLLSGMPSMVFFWDAVVLVWYQACRLRCFVWGLTWVVTCSFVPIAFGISLAIPLVNCTLGISLIELVLFFDASAIIVRMLESP